MATNLPPGFKLPPGFVAPPTTPLATVTPPPPAASNKTTVKEPPVVTNDEAAAPPLALSGKAFHVAVVSAGANVGKSSLINALLNQPILKTALRPTGVRDVYVR